jgi:hypothetical protein
LSNGEPVKVTTYIPFILLGLALSFLGTAQAKATSAQPMAQENAQESQAKAQELAREDAQKSPKKAWKQWNEKHPTAH